MKMTSPSSLTTSPLPSRGAFIVFEGLDKSGKSTQSLKLYDNLIKVGHKVKHMRFPGIFIHHSL